MVFPIVAEEEEQLRRPCPRLKVGRIHLRRLEEAIDYVNEQLPSDDSSVPAVRLIVAINSTL
ncbi:unnamed protein product [Coffea canephora]|uniref:Uncharacterized protein n=1 Tax=Coffea canephora TaxID=49390 RepID=A0A068UXQ8_COFCA|nr:unnamed protein product [Coffea canephora]